jgi:hypothetical protein
MLAEQDHMDTSLLNITMLKEQDHMGTSLLNITMLKEQDHMDTSLLNITMLKEQNHMGTGLLNHMDTGLRKQVNQQPILVETSYMHSFITASYLFCHQKRSTVKYALRENYLHVSFY